MPFSSNISLRAMLIGGFLLCALLTGLSGGLGIFSLSKINNTIDITAQNVTKNVNTQNNLIHHLIPIRNMIKQIEDADSHDEIKKINSKLIQIKSDISKYTKEIKDIFHATQILAGYKKNQISASTELNTLMAKCIQALETIKELTIQSVNASIDESITSIEKETQSLKKGFGNLLWKKSNTKNTDMNLDKIFAKNGINDMMDELMMVSEMSISSVRAAMSVQSNTNRQFVLVKDIFSSLDLESLNRASKEIMLLKGYINSEIVELPDDGTTEEVVIHFKKLSTFFEQIITIKKEELKASSKLNSQSQIILNMMTSIESGLIKKGNHLTQNLNATMKSNSSNIKKWQFIQIVFVISAIILAVFIGGFLSRNITRPLYKIIDGLSERAKQVKSASDEISSTGNSLAQGTQEQAGSIMETSSSIEQISSMTRKNTENAAEADQLMSQANLVVHDANTAMAQLTRSMEDISKASEETSKIIKTIDEIAFQTNLLALNTAVEAARAGEAGAGFAVVADEVRNLAMRAADAARDTTQLLEGTRAKINDGSMISSTTNEAFEKVTQSTTKIGQLVAEIARASKEQSKGIEQVNNAISGMDRIVQQNTSNSEKSSSAAEELNSQAEQMKTYVNDLVLMVTGKSDNDVSHLPVAI